MPLAYYNDRFDLNEGDVVYVSGKLADEPGVVVSVTTKFRIHTSDYERVLSLLDLTIHGSFSGVRDKMVYAMALCINFVVLNGVAARMRSTSSAYMSTNSAFGICLMVARYFSGPFAVGGGPCWLPMQVPAVSGQALS